MPLTMDIVEAKPKTKKRFTAIFRLHKGGSTGSSAASKGGSGGKVIKITNFGQRNPKIGTYIDHGDKKIRAAYRARHGTDLETKDFKRAGYLSYYLLWGDSDNLNKNIELYKKKFNLK